MASIALIQTHASSPVAAVGCEKLMNNNTLINDVARAQTQYTQPQASSSSDYQRSTYPRKHPGQTRKGKGPQRDDMLHTLFCSPVTARTPRRENRPPLLPLPPRNSSRNIPPRYSSRNSPPRYSSRTSPHNSPRDEMDLDDIKVTLNRLVSHLIEGIERIVHVYASLDSEYFGLLECGLGGYKVTDCIAADRVTDCIVAD